MSIPEVVMECREVWEGTLRVVMWPSRDLSFFDMSDDELEVRIAEAALLGLGVRWLMNVPRFDIGVELELAKASGISDLTAVYSAIKMVLNDKA